MKFYDRERELELLVDRGASTRDKMINLIVREDSTFLEEGRALRREGAGAKEDRVPPDDGRVQGV